MTSQELQDIGREVSCRTKWHVAKTGDNGNDGKSYTTAKLSIAGAIAVAADGDEIVVWPSATAYEESVNLTTKSSMKLTILSGAVVTNVLSGNTIRMGNDCEVCGGGKVINVLESGIAVQCPAKSNPRIHGLIIESVADGIFVSGTGSTDIYENRITAAEYGIQTSIAGTIRDNKISCSGWSFCWSEGIFVDGVLAIVKDNTISVSISSADADHRPIGIGVHGAGLAICSGNTISAVGESGTECYGIGAFDTATVFSYANAISTSCPVNAVDYFADTGCLIFSSGKEWTFLGSGGFSTSDLPLKVFWEEDGSIDSKTPQECLRYVSSMLCGLLSGARTNNEVYKGLDGVTPRVAVTSDAAGNRSIITYDPT